MVRAQYTLYRLGLGLGPGNGFYSFFFFFPALKSDEHLMRCHFGNAVYVRRNAAFTLHLGHVTGDMKRHESNGTSDD